MLSQARGGHGAGLEFGEGTRSEIRRSPIGGSGQTRKEPDQVIGKPLSNCVW